MGEKASGFAGVDFPKTIRTVTARIRRTILSDKMDRRSFIKTSAIGTGAMVTLNSFMNFSVCSMPAKKKPVNWLQKCIKYSKRHNYLDNKLSFTYSK